MAVSSSSIPTQSRWIRFGDLEDGLSKIKKNPNVQKISWLKSEKSFFSIFRGINPESLAKFGRYISESQHLKKLSIVKIELNGVEIKFLSTVIRENKSLKALRLDLSLVNLDGIYGRDASHYLNSSENLNKLITVLKNHPTLKKVSLKFDFEFFISRELFSKSIVDLASKSKLKDLRVWNVPDQGLVLLGQALSQNKGSVKFLELMYDRLTYCPSMEIFFRAFLTNTKILFLRIDGAKFKDMKFLDFLKDSPSLERLDADRCCFSKRQLVEISKSLPKEIRFSPKMYMSYDHHDGFGVGSIVELSASEISELKRLRRAAPSRVPTESAVAKSTSSAPAASTTSQASSSSSFDSVRRTTYGTFALLELPAISSGSSSACSSST